ncbi:MAG: hypothetical protein NT080_14720 [Spirochaetes bacterium]|nr:hypothetical protein [Spirochaetota bacterium]
MGLFSKALVGRSEKRKVGSGLFGKASILRADALSVLPVKKKEPEAIDHDRLAATRRLLLGSTPAYSFPFALFSSLLEGLGSPASTLLRIDADKSLYESVAVHGFDQETAERQVVPADLLNRLTDERPSVVLSGDRLSSLKPFFSPLDFIKLEYTTVIRFGPDFLVLVASAFAVSTGEALEKIAADSTDWLNASFSLVHTEREIVRVPHENLPGEIIERAIRYGAGYIFVVELDCLDLIKETTGAYPCVPQDVVHGDALSVFSRILGFSGDVFRTIPPKGLGVLYLKSDPDPELLLRQLMLAFDKTYGSGAPSPTITRTLPRSVDDPGCTREIERFLNSVTSSVEPVGA